LHPVKEAVKGFLVARVPLAENHLLQAELQWKQILICFSRFLVVISILSVVMIAQIQQEKSKMEEKPYSELTMERIAKELVEDNGVAQFSVIVIDTTGKATFGWNASPETKMKMISWMMEIMVSDIFTNKLALINTTAMKS
jgi:hypothetical protein